MRVCYRVGVGRNKEEEVVGRQERQRAEEAEQQWHGSSSEKACSIADSGRKRARQAGGRRQAVGAKQNAPLEKRPVQQVGAAGRHGGGENVMTGHIFLSGRHQSE